MIAEEEATESSPKSLPLHLEDSVSHPQEETNSNHRGEIKSNRREDMKSHPKEVTKSNPKDETKSSSQKETKSNPKDEMKSSPQKETKSNPQKEIKSSPQEEIKNSNGSDDHHNHQLLRQNDSYFLAKVKPYETLKNSVRIDYTNPGDHMFSCFDRLCIRLMLKRKEN